MPLRIRWSSKEYMGIAFILLGACGILQMIITFIAIYLLSIGNYLVTILIPLGAMLALAEGALVSYESFAQVERRERLKHQYKKSKKKNSIIKAIVESLIFKSLFIIFFVFIMTFIISYSVSIIFLDNVLSFIVTEFIATLVCLLVANMLERNFAKIKRF